MGSVDAAGGRGSWFMASTALALLLLLTAGGGCGVAAQISCSDAVSALIPCGSYLIGQGAPEPSPQCCQSAGGLVGVARTAEQRRQLCECLKQTGPSFGVRPERASSLASFCKLNLNIPVSPNVDCNRVS